jgi:serine/threonine-protein kinase
MGAAEPQATERLGRYEVAGRLAAGGMAEILLGRLVGPSGFERPVVIKRILPHLAQEGSFVSMFLDEARLAARIRHPNVVQVHELGVEDENLYLVMEYLEGENSAGVVRRGMITKRPTDFAMIAYVVAEACAGLHAAHELEDSDGSPLNLVHRDISPQNIFVTYAGSVKVLDFGIAKAADRITQTEAGQLKGKFEYMSPEQCRGRPIDRRSDIFALGIVLFELTTRKRLFKRSSKLAVLDAVCRDPIPKPSEKVPDYPAPLEAVVLKALARDPDQRYASASEMRRALLGAMREIDAPLVPEEALATLMREMFADRVESKGELLARLRAGARITEVPAAEADSGVELPEVEPGAPSLRERLESGFSFGSVSGEMDPYAAARARARTARFMVVGGAVALLSLATGVVLLLRVPEAPPPVLAHLGRNPVQDVTRLATPPPKVFVTVDVESKPSGASVWVFGKQQGKTPYGLKVQQDDKPLEVSIRLPDHLDALEKVTPDVNQRLRVSLSKKDEKRGSSRVTVTRPKQVGGFRRFD